MSVPLWTDPVAPLPVDQVDPWLPRPGEALRMMHVHAHPDDESSKGAASTALYVSQGVEVLVVSCTGGERGDILNKAFDLDAHGGDISEVRRREMARAAEILGVQHRWLGFEDSGFPDPDESGVRHAPEGTFAALAIETASGPLVELVRSFRPHVLTTYDEHGGYPHPDHIRTHEVAVEAFNAAADPARYPGEAAPWQPLKLYFHMTFHKARVVAMHESLLEMGIESPYGDWLKDWEDQPHDAERLTTMVPCAEFFEVRDQALLAHETQIDPEGPWFKVGMDVQKVIWPTEDYQLARSYVPTKLPETDLFAGLRGQERA